MTNARNAKKWLMPNDWVPPRFPGSVAVVPAHLSAGCANYYIAPRPLPIWHLAFGSHHSSFII
jgi:hypothetical protein